jgi:hypothetical protein
VNANVVPEGKIMKRISIALVLAAATAASVYAYNGRTAVTKGPEAEHGIQFDVTFQEHDGMLLVTVVAPQKVKDLSLSQFAVIQMEKDKTTLRVPMTAAQWTAVPDAEGKLKLKAGDMSPKVVFAVSQARLPDTQLEVTYGSGEPGWTYVVDLETYQKNKEGTTKPSTATE